MKYIVTDYIINHILMKLGVIESKIIMIREDYFRLEDQIEYMRSEIDDTKTTPLFAAQIATGSSTVSVICATMSYNEGCENDYYAIIKQNNMPSYGLALSDDGVSYIFDGKFSILLENKWIDTDVAMQGQVLTAVEGLPNIIGEWTTVANPKNLIRDITSFIDYCWST